MNPESWTSEPLSAYAYCIRYTKYKCQELFSRCAHLADAMAEAAIALDSVYYGGYRLMTPFLSVLSDMIEKGIPVRLLHAKESGPNFRKDFDRFPPLVERLERMLCPRVHFKSVIVDGKRAYSGSADLTGAGMGAKSENRRNFESGILTDDPVLVNSTMDQFDQVWIGGHCEPCRRKQYCPDCPFE